MGHCNAKKSSPHPNPDSAQSPPAQRGSPNSAPGSRGTGGRPDPRGDGPEQPSGYLVRDVGPHLPGVPAVPQQQRLVLVAVEQLERLPHLRPKHGRVSGERDHPGHGRTRPDLPPPAPSRSPGSPPPARRGAGAARGAAWRPASALHPPPPPPPAARPHVPAWAPPFCHAAPPAPPPPRPSRRGHPRWRRGAPSICLRPDPLPERLGRRAGRRVLGAGRGSGGSSRRRGFPPERHGGRSFRCPSRRGRWRGGHGAEPEGPGGAAADRAPRRRHRAQAAAGRRRPGLRRARVRLHCGGRPARHLLQPHRRRAAGHHPGRGAALQDPLVPVPHHLRHPSAAAENLLPHWFQRPADGEHLAAGADAAQRGRAAQHVPAPGAGLRGACAALHRQRGAQERRGQVQRLAAHHTEGPAQQEAQRAQFLVEKAKQEQKQKIVQAEGEATAAKMLGEALSRNPGYIKLRKIRAAQNISKTIAASQNRVYLTADNLVLNLQDEAFTR
uniref:Prohibitin-2 n=1 Tax=Taeniopygia guttata TaxID=59729 RepID=A0A674G6X6_TAEGU